MYRRSVIIPVILLSALLLSACSSASKEVTDTYWEYWQACQDGMNNIAGAMLTADALARTEIEGVCMFTHDYINIIEETISGVEHTFSDDPIVEITEDTASIIWTDDQGYLIVVSMELMDGEWKIQGLFWSL